MGDHMLAVSSKYKVSFLQFRFATCPCCTTSPAPSPSSTRSPGSSNPSTWPSGAPCGSWCDARNAIVVTSSEWGFRPSTTKNLHSITPTTSSTLSRSRQSRWPVCSRNEGAIPTKIGEIYSQFYASFTQIVVLLIFVMYDWFCQAVCPIFEIGIFLSLRPILCNVMSVGQMLTKISRTVKIGPILAVLCKRGVSKLEQYNNFHKGGSKSTQTFFSLRFCVLSYKHLLFKFMSILA